MDAGIEQMWNVLNHRPGEGRMEPQEVTLGFRFRLVPELSSDPEPADGHTDLHSICWYSRATGT